jgi:hypothetical protein
MNVNPEPGQTVIPIFTIEATLTVCGVPVRLAAFNMHATNIEDCACDLRDNRNKMRQYLGFLGEFDLVVHSIREGSITYPCEKMVTDPLAKVGAVLSASLLEFIKS